MGKSHGMNIYLYCVCEQASESNKAALFKLVNADGLNSLRSSAKTAHSCTPRTVFALGPFLDSDEAKDVQSQAQSLLAKYRVQGDWLGINPLEIAEFWTWIDAQILPIRVHEKRTRLRHSYTSIRKVGRTMASAEHWAAVEHATAKAPRSQS